MLIQNSVQTALRDYDQTAHLVFILWAVSTRAWLTNTCRCFHRSAVFRPIIGRPGRFDRAIGCRGPIATVRFSRLDFAHSINTAAGAGIRSSLYWRETCFRVALEVFNAHHQVRNMAFGTGNAAGGGVGGRLHHGVPQALDVRRVAQRHAANAAAITANRREFIAIIANEKVKGDSPERWAA